MDTETQTAPAPAIATGQETQSFSESFSKAMTAEPEVQETKTVTEPKPAVVKEVVKEAPKRDIIPQELITPTEKKDEPVKSVLDEIQKPDIKDKKVSSQWDALRTKAQEFEGKLTVSEKRIAEQEAKIKEFEAKGKDTEALQAKLADLEKTNSEYKTLVQKVNAELDPEYQKNFVQGRQSLIKKAQDVASEEGIDPKAIETALALKGKPRADALRELTSELQPFQQSRFGLIIQELDNLDEKAAAIRSNPDEYLAAQREQRERQQAQRRDERTKFTKSAWEEAKGEMVKELKLLADLDDTKFPGWQERRNKILSGGEAFFMGNGDLKEGAKASIRAAAAPIYESMLIAEQEYSAKITKERDDAVAELEKLYKTGPGLRKGSSNTNTAAMTFSESFSHQIKQ